MNTGFRQNPPAVRQVLGSGKNWELVEDGFSYKPWKIRDVENVDLNIEVPKGFVTDFASIPRALWVILHPTGRYGSAAIIHDYICRQAKREEIYIVPNHKIAAYIFRDAMVELGVGGFRASTMCRSVIWFGPKWKKRSKA